MLSVLWFIVSALLICAGFFCLWPLVARWRIGDGPLLVMLLTVGLSMGLLSLWSFALAAFGVLTVWPVAVLVVACWVAGWRVNPDWFRLARARDGLRSIWQDAVPFNLSTVLLLAIAGSLAVIFVNDLYYPFISDDALTLYALHARLIYEGSGLTKHINGFPLLVSLNYTFAWLVHGSVNDHLAKLVPVIFGAGLIGSSVALARRILPDASGAGHLLAGAIVAVTPLFIENTSTGYVDIPTGFYVTLATLYAIRWAEYGLQDDALLAGLLTGLAAWSKQSAVMLIASMAGVAALRALLSRRWREGLIGLALLVLPAVAIAGPWYARNFVIEGGGGVLVLPGEYHVTGIHPEVAGLLPPLQYPAEFGPGLAWLYAVAILAAITHTARGLWWSVTRKQALPTADIVMAGVTLPYWLAWWLRFSFTPRFLLLIMGIYAVWLARELWVLASLEWPGRRVALVAAPLFAALLFFGARGRLGGVYHAFTNPLASDAEKLVRVKQDLYPTAVWIRENVEPDSRILTMDGRLRYYLTDFNVVVGYPRDFEQISRFAYIVDASGTADIYRTLGWTNSDYWLHRRDPAYFEAVFDGGSGTEVFRVLPAVTDAE